MKAITIYQPYAGALACGVKKYETRSWSTKYRGPVAIHASVWDVMQDVFAVLEQISAPTSLKIKEMLSSEWSEVPRGTVIAIGELVDCIRITPKFVKTLSADELALGDFSLGHYAWKFENVHKLPEPIPAKGQQRLWNWPAVLLQYKGRDSWSRPVYIDESDKFWKDVEPVSDHKPNLCTAMFNAFDGEPDMPIQYMKKYEDMPVVFFPKRDVWK